MVRLNISPATITGKQANVYLKNANAYYDKNAKVKQRMTLLEGSFVSDDHDATDWIPGNLEELARMGYLKKVTGGYSVIKPVWGSPSGTAASVLGRSGSSKPNGHDLWKFKNGQTIKAAGETP